MHSGVVKNILQVSICHVPPDQLPLAPLGVVQTSCNGACGEVNVNPDSPTLSRMPPTHHSFFISEIHLPLFVAVPPGQIGNIFN